LPLAGAFIAITTSAFIIANKLKNLWALGEKAVFGVLALTVIVLVVATHARNIVWQDNLTLWEDAAKKSPGKPRVHNNLGLAYAAKGLRDDAIKHYKIALELAPDFAEAHNNIGVAYALNHLSNIAIGHYRIALRLKPDYVDAHFNLAMQYLDKGDLDNARKIFEAMLQISPHNSQALHFLNYIANRQASSR
jgi:tetratricopeptide (TPR) repeat protein